MKERGATLVEYAIMVAVFVLLCVAGFRNLADNISCAFSSLTAGIAYAGSEGGETPCQFSAYETTTEAGSPGTSVPIITGGPTPSAAPSSSDEPSSSQDTPTAGDPPSTEDPPSTDLFF